MAKVTGLVILNPADKTHMYSVSTGKGVPTDVDDPIVADIRRYPVGSQYTDLTGKKFYVRTGEVRVAADWSVVGTGA